VIAFKCPTCGRGFSVPDHFAGRKANCKTCQTPLLVPKPSEQQATSPEKLPLRTRRLMSDAQQIRAAFDNFPLIRIHSTLGDPPDTYQIDYFVNGLQASPNGKPIRRTQHRVQIQLTSEYPRLAPRCKMLTPIFHPNIDPTTICIGDHWTAGERLAHLIVRIGEMITYQAYNIKSPLDGEAAMWADLNADKLPLDSRPLHPPGLE
jgi:ubiquitin-protein ligase